MKQILFTSAVALALIACGGSGSENKEAKTEVAAPMTDAPGALIHQGNEECSAHTSKLSTPIACRKQKMPKAYPDSTTIAEAEPADLLLRILDTSSLSPPFALAKLAATAEPPLVTVAGRRPPSAAFFLRSTPGPMPFEGLDFLLVPWPRSL